LSNGGALSGGIAIPSALSTTLTIANGRASESPSPMPSQISWPRSLPSR